MSVSLRTPGLTSCLRVSLALPRLWEPPRAHAGPPPRPGGLPSVVSAFAAPDARRRGSCRHRLQDHGQGLHAGAEQPSGCAGEQAGPCAAARTLPPAGLGALRHTGFTAEQTCLEVRRVNLPVEIQSSYFIFRPLCVAK